MPTPTNATVTVEQPDGGTVDEYGNPIGAFTSVGSFSVWLERTGWNPPDASGDVGEADDWLLVIPSDLPLNRGDRIVDGTRTFQLVADSETLKRPGGTTHHTEARLRPALPTLQELVTRGLSLSDRCTIDRASADESFDTSTGVYTPASSTQVYVGPCRVLARAEDDRSVLVVDDARSVRSTVLVLPYDVVDVEVDDVATVTSSDDPRLTGRGLRVTGVEVSSDATARVVYCEDEQQ